MSISVCTDKPTGWQPRLKIEAELRTVDERLAFAPDDVDLCCRHAALLARLGRLDEARDAYLKLLAFAPTHFGALNGLGTLLVDTGFRTAARTAYLQTVKCHPDNPIGHINLANTLVQSDEIDAALRHFEIALRLAPDHPEAHRGLAYLLTNLGDEQAAEPHRARAFRDRPVLTFPYRGTATPIRVLVLASAAGGTVPIRRQLSEDTFQTTVLFVDYFDSALPLPPHDVVFNAVGDADLCRPALDAARGLLHGTSAPVINRPEQVLATGRAENARRLASLPGVVTPKMTLVPRPLLESSSAAAELARLGFTFPLLLRSPGFHTGRFFVRVDDERGLAAAVGDMPGSDLMAIEFLPARSADGRIRKYRVMMIGGQLFPLHAAISREWKIHYFSAEMADDAQNRAEDAAFLTDMPRVLGQRAMAALQAISRTLNLDYAGADFSLNETGDVLLFEANATMVVNPPPPDAKWDYRRPAVARVLDAIRRLLSQTRILTSALSDVI